MIRYIIIGIYQVSGTVWSYDQVYKQQIRKPAVVDRIKGKGNKMGARSCKLLLIGTDSGLITVGLPASVFWIDIVCLLQIATNSLTRY